MIRTEVLAEIELAQRENRCADLYGADLTGANLRGADLRYANLRGANLRGADLRAVNLRGANLYGADLISANLRYANLRGANLRGADLRAVNLRAANLYGADLTGANLRGADLYGVNLRYADLISVNLRAANLYGADLTGANLRGADLTKAQWDYTTVGLAPAPEGALIVWGNKSGHIVKMRVPEDARRSCATTRKHRSEYAEVLEIDGGALTELVYCYCHQPDTHYVVGERVYADGWDEDRWNECSHGIHWFLTRNEAEMWR